MMQFFRPPYGKKHFLVLLIFFLFCGIFSLAKCSEWDFLKVSLAEATISSRVRWNYSRCVDQYDMVLPQSEFIVEMSSSSFIPRFQKTYYDTKMMSNKDGILEIAPTKHLNRIRCLNDDSYIPLNYVPISVISPSVFDDPTRSEYFAQYNGMPNKPMTIDVWKKVGPQKLVQYSLPPKALRLDALNITRTKPLFFAFNPFSGEQITPDSIVSSTYAVVIREWYEGGWERIGSYQKFPELHGKFILTPKGFSWYYVDSEITGKYCHPLIFGVFPRKLHKLPMMKPVEKNEVRLALKSDSSSMSALLILDLKQNAGWEGEVLNSRLKIHIIINPQGTSFESFERTDYWKSAYVNDYSWQGCNNKIEFHALNPSFPEIERREIKLLSPVFDSEYIVPAIWDQKPLKYFEIH